MPNLFTVLTAHPTELMFTYCAGHPLTAFILLDQGVAFWAVRSLHNRIISPPCFDAVRIVWAAQPLAMVIS